MELRPGYKHTEVGVIPEEWEVSTVGREFDIKLGKMLDAEKNVGVPKPYLGNKAVQWDRIDISALPTVPMSRADIERYRLRDGDLLACEGGEVGRAAIWDAPIEECYYQKALHRLRPLRCFDSRLMVALLRLWSDRGRLANYVTQTSIAHLPREKFLEVPMPVPPLPEQRAIAGVLGDVDDLIASLGKLIVKKRNLKQATMQQLLTGQTRLPGFSGVWEVKRLGEVATMIKGRGLSKTHLSNSGTRPCILYGELFTTYGRVISEVVSRTTADDGLPSQAGDVLVPGSTTTTGIDLATASALLQEGVALGGDINVIRQKVSSFSAVFLANYLTHVMQSAIAELAQGITIIHLYGRDLATLSLCLPSVAEQTAITTVLSDMDAELAALEQRLSKTRALKQGMMQELLTGRTRLV